MAGGSWGGSSPQEEGELALPGESGIPLGKRALPRCLGPPGIFRVACLGLKRAFWVRRHLARCRGRGRPGCIGGEQSAMRLERKKHLFPTEKVISTLSSQGLIPSGDMFLLRSVTGPSQEPVLKHPVPTVFTVFLVHPAPPTAVQGPLSMVPMKVSCFLHIRTQTT